MCRGGLFLAAMAWAGAWPPALRRGPGCTCAPFLLLCPCSTVHHRTLLDQTAGQQLLTLSQVPTATVHCITFVAPPVGNKAFVHAFRYEPLIMDVPDVRCPAKPSC